MLNALPWLLIFALAITSIASISIRLVGPVSSVFVTPLFLTLVVWIGTELLSSTSLLDRPVVEGVWLTFTLITFIVALVTHAYAMLWDVIKSLGFWLRQSPRLLLFALGIVTVVWVITFSVAIISPPNNWDSMTYHLPRVMHWITNQSIEPYPTAVTRQVALPPLSSYAIMHTIMVTGDDYLANLLNWLLGVWCLGLVALIAWTLTKNQNVTVLSIFIAGTIPIGIAESTTTQNDWWFTAWTLMMAAALVLVGSTRLSTSQLRLYCFWIVPATLMCAVVTKPQALISCSIVFMFLLFQLWINKKLRFLAGTISFSIIAVLVSSAPQIARNLRSVGNPLGPPDQTQVPLERGILNPLEQVTGILGHALFNIPMPRAIPIEEMGDKLFGLFGTTTYQVFAELDWSRYLPFPGLQLHEDSAANPVSFFLGPLACIWILSRRPSRTIQLYLYSALTVGLFVILFWDAYVGTNRYLLPFFTLAAVPLAMVATLLSRRLLKSAIGLVSVYSLLFVTNLEYRPLFGRSSIFLTDRFAAYFNARPTLLDQGLEYYDFVNSIEPLGSGPVVVPVFLGLDDYEYPLWKAKSLGRIKIENRITFGKARNQEVFSKQVPFAWNHTNPSVAQIQ